MAESPGSTSTSRPKTVHRAPRPLGLDRAVGAVRGATRSWGRATADWRPGPDYLLIGTKRGGTTSMHFQLLEHELVLPMFPSARFMPGRRDSKGTHYFASDYHHDDRWFRSHFPSRAKRAAVGALRHGTTVVGDSSPYSLFHPLAAERAAARLPDARILVALRDPVERTHSAWREQHRNGVEELGFEDALAAEPERMAGEEERLVAEPGSYSFAHEFQSYASQSRYAEALGRWYAAFPREQIHVWASEDYYTDPAGTTSAVFAFLGLPPGDVSHLSPMNAAPSASMDEQVRERLRDSFAEDVAATEELVGARMPWPNFR